MFRALLCSSSGGQNCILQHLVSSHFVGSRPVHRLGEDIWYLIFHAYRYVGSVPTSVTQHLHTTPQPITSPPCYVTASWVEFWLDLCVFPVRIHLDFASSWSVCLYCRYWSCVEVYMFFAYPSAGRWWEKKWELRRRQKFVYSERPQNTDWRIVNVMKVLENNCYQLSNERRYRNRVV